MSDSEQADDAEQNASKKNDDSNVAVRPEVNLQNPGIAALLAWLLPGAGHMYQRRYAKGALFMICILGTFFYGLMMGGGRVVYASWKPNDHRWQFAGQLAVGAPALPAIAQWMKTKGGEKPFFVLAERFPQGHHNEFEPINNEDMASYDGRTLTDGWMAPPPGPSIASSVDVLGKWHEELLWRFELGTLFTVIAGLLNVLAIYDAYAGPAFEETDEERELRKKKKKKSDKKD